MVPECPHVPKIVSIIPVRVVDGLFGAPLVWGRQIRLRNHSVPTHMSAQSSTAPSRWLVRKGISSGYLIVWWCVLIDPGQGSLFNYHKEKERQFRLPIVPLDP